MLLVAASWQWESWRMFGGMFCRHEINIVVPFILFVCSMNTSFDCLWCYIFWILLSLCELTTHNTITKNCLKLVANELLHWEYQIPFLFLLAKAFFFVDIPKVFRKNVISVIIFSEPLVKYSLHSWSHMFKGLDCSVLFNSVLRLKEIICIQSKKRGETVQT